jgi:hypothetical protein
MHRPRSLRDIPSKMRGSWRFLARIVASFATIVSGLAAAEGDLVFLLDGDDCYQRRHVETRLQRWEQFPQADVVCGRASTSPIGFARVLLMRATSTLPNTKILNRLELP